MFVFGSLGVGKRDTAVTRGLKNQFRDPGEVEPNGGSPRLSALSCYLFEEPEEKTGEAVAAPSNSQQ